MTFTRKVVIEERVPAWKECPTCNGCPVAILTERVVCSACQDSGGKWHEAVKEYTASGPEPSYYVGNLSGAYQWLTKSSILVREWGVCRACNGKMKVGFGTYEKDCNYCHKDADSKPTGAEPGTAGEWRVE